MKEPVNIKLAEEGETAHRVSYWQILKQNSPKLLNYPHIYQSLRNKKINKYIPLYIHIYIYIKEVYGSY